MIWDCERWGWVLLVAALARARQSWRLSCVYRRGHLLHLRPELLLSATHLPSAPTLHPSICALRVALNPLIRSFSSSHDSVENPVLGSPNLNQTTTTTARNDSRLTTTRILTIPQHRNLTCRSSYNRIQRVDPSRHASKAQDRYF